MYARMYRCVYLCAVCMQQDKLHVHIPPAPSGRFSAERTSGKPAGGWEKLMGGGT
jgi:hypothetical protein